VVLTNILRRINDSHIKKLMKKLNFEGMPLDDLWALYEQIGTVLSSRIVVEKQQLENRLAQLHGRKEFDQAIRRDLKTSKKTSKEDLDRPRRRYPKVFPKYQNPAVPAETWSGRGKRPRWLVSALKAGRAIEDFKIHSAGGPGK
jgi:DNA-binding protein H-NS